MTTNLDLFRDCLRELIIDFDFQVDVSNDGDGEYESMPEWMIEELVDDTMTLVENYVEESAATRYDESIRVVIEKVDTKTEFGYVRPEKNGGSVIL